MARSNAPVGLIQQQLTAPDYVDNFVLAGAAVTVTKPSWAVWAYIEPSDDITMRVGATATAITANVVDGTGNWPIHPNGGYANVFNVKSILAFSLFGTANVGVAWYGDHSVL